VPDDESRKRIVHSQRRGSTARKYLRFGAELPRDSLLAAHGRQVRPQAGELALGKVHPCFVKQEAELNVLEGVDRAASPAHRF